jgi:hypothetical protein
MLTRGRDNRDILINTMVQYTEFAHHNLHFFNKNLCLKIVVHEIWKYNFLCIILIVKLCLEKVLIKSDFDSLLWGHVIYVEG